MEIFHGYLFSKLAAIGSKSEGTQYNVQSFDYAEHVVIKKATPWQDDPVLHQYLDKKVTIEGEKIPDGIMYERISKYDPMKHDETMHRLQVTLKTGLEIVWLNKMPQGQHDAQRMEITLSVEWPYRSIWEGWCPTTQLCDFWIEYQGAVVWRWSDGKIFGEAITPVKISGGTPHEFTEIWEINPDAVVMEGVYSAKGLFIGSNQEATADFEIKFAH